MINAATGYCVFPNCPEKEDRAGFCIGHARHFAGPKPGKAKTPAPKESKKTAKENRKYRKIVKSVAAEDNSCKVKSPVCIGVMQGMNHKQKRSPKNKMERSNLTECCNPCNQYIENNAAWAKANGHFISRFVK